MSELLTLFPQATTDKLKGELDDLLNTYGLTPSELHFKWEAYAISHETGDADEELSIATRLEEFKVWLRQKSESQPRKRQKTTATPARLGGSRGVTESPNTSIGNTSIGNTSIGNSSIGSAFEPRSPGTPSTPSTPSSVSSRYGDKGTPSTPGLNIRTLNGGLDVSQVPVEKNVNIEVESDIEAFDYRPMFQKLSASSRALDKQLEEAIDRVIAAQGITRAEVANPVHMSQSQELVIGRVCADIPEKNEVASEIEPLEDMEFALPLDNRALALETSRRIGAGMRVRLDIKSLKSTKSPAFFKGQIAVFRGSNPTGQEFSATEMLELPKFSAESQQEPLDKHISIAVGAGPFTTGQLDYAPLRRLIDQSSEASLLLLIGPLVDDSDPAVTEGKFGTPEQIFESHIKPILAQSTTRIIYVPSIHDATNSHAVFPQPPMTLPGLDVTSVPNPNSVLIDNKIRLITTSLPATRDVSSQASGDIGQRLAFKHILRQRRLYPVFPSTAKDVSIDVSHSDLAAFAEDTPPNILVVPGPQISASIVDNVLCVNPGSCGSGTKTWAKINILPGESILRQTRIDIVPL